MMHRGLALRRQACTLSAVGFELLGPLSHPAHGIICVCGNTHRYRDRALPPRRRAAGRAGGPPGAPALPLRHTNKERLVRGTDSNVGLVLTVFAPLRFAIESPEPSSAHEIQKVSRNDSGRLRLERFDAAKPAAQLCTPGAVIHTAFSPSPAFFADAAFFNCARWAFGS